jgi:mono/diheme cytochrome c family protein
MRFSTVLAVGLLAVSQAALAASQDPRREKILADYAAAAKAANPGFAAFSAERGRAIYLGPHQANAEIPACAACHTNDPRQTGRHVKTGRPIDPMAASAKPARFTDVAEVEKRFGRDCKSVLGRDCTALDKGDFLTFLISQ